MVGECWRTDGHPPTSTIQCCDRPLPFRRDRIAPGRACWGGALAGRSGLHCRRATTPPPSKSRGARQDRVHHAAVVMAVRADAVVSSRKSDHSPLCWDLLRQLKEGRQCSIYAGSARSLIPGCLAIRCLRIFIPILRFSNSTSKRSFHAPRFSSALKVSSLPQAVTLRPRSDGRQSWSCAITRNTARLLQHLPASRGADLRNGPWAQGTPRLSLPSMDIPT